MAGLIITWDESEIQAINEDNFEEIVVELVDNFFAAVEGHSNVTVEWSAGNGAWDYGSQYNLMSPPIWQNKQCIFQIKGRSRGGEYGLVLNSSRLYVEQLSTGQVMDLDYLTLRAPGVTVNAEHEEVFVESIPKKIRKRLVESLPTIEI